jgi:site-specific DNA recombinase
MRKGEINAIAIAITDLMSVLRAADPADKSEVHTQLGLRLTYHPGPRTVSARAELGRSCTKGSCPRGDLNPHALYGH